MGDTRDQVEGLVPITGSAGSIPVSGTLKRKGLRRCGVNPFCVLFPLLGTFWDQDRVYVADASIVPSPTIFREDAMAFLEKRGNRFRIIFRHGGRRYTHTLKTSDESIAQGLKGGIEKTLMLLHQKVLKVPDGIETLPFI